MIGKPRVIGGGDGCGSVLIWVILALAIWLRPGPAAGQACAPLACSAVSWWPGDYDFRDVLGGNDGVPMGGPALLPGEVGNAFDFDGYTQFVQIPNAPSLNPAGSFSIEGWIFPRVDGLQAVMSKWADTWGVAVNQDSFQFNELPQEALTFTFVEVAGAQAVSTPPNVLTLNAWNHVAAVFDQANGWLEIYVNGVLVAQQTGVFSPMAASEAPMVIGGVADRGGQPSYLYNGRIDEMTFYEGALSAALIQEIYTTGAAGKGWQASNLPIIYGQPQGGSATAGNAFLLQVDAGCPPLGYQWQCNGTNVPGATNAILDWPGLQMGNAGIYQVVVTNAYGQVTSKVAGVTVLPAECRTAPAGLVAWWQAQGNATDSVGGKVGVPQGSFNYVPGKVGPAFAFGGGSSALVVPDAPNLNFSAAGAMTVELWCCPTSTVAPMQILGKSDPNSQFHEYLLALDPIQGLGFYSGYAGVWSSNPLPTNQWVHVAGTYANHVLCVYTNGVLVAVQQGNFWSQTTAPLIIGGAASGLGFAGYLDEVSFYNRALSAEELASIYAAGPGGKCGGGLPPVVIVTPQPQNSTPGQTVGLTVAAGGSAPLGYQWYIGTAALAGATNAALIFTNVMLLNAGAYSVVLSNAFGQATSAVARLTVTSQPPVVLQNPSGGTVTAGNDFRLAVQALGDPPLNYQWLWNGKAFPEATNAVLALTSALMTAAGDYSAVVSNSGGATTSAVATLSAVAPHCVPIPAGLVGWWAGEGNRLDSARGDTAAGTPGYAPGKVGKAFWFTNYDGIVIPNSAGFGWTETGPMSFEFWVYLPGDKLPTLATDGGRFLLGKFDARDYSGFLVGVDADSGWNFGTFPPSVRSGVPPLTDTWMHLAGTADGQFYRLYTNGVLAATATGGPTGTNAAPMFIGGADGVFMDEVSLYNQVLTANEIAAIYRAGSAGKCSGATPPAILLPPQSQSAFAGSLVNLSVTAGGSAPLLYQWWRNASPLSGSTNSSLTFTNAADANAGTYWVVVANGLGMATSAVARLVIQDVAPVIGGQPRSVTTIAGEDAVFSVTARGTPPLTYQWWHGSAPIPGGTASTLVINNVGGSNTGEYWVMVRNPAGSATSSVATLAGVAAACVAPPLGLVAWWRGEGDAVDRVAGLQGILNSGVGYSTGFAGRGFAFNGVDGRIVIPADPALDFAYNTPLTVELWAYPTNPSVGTLHLLGNRTADCGYFSYQLASDPVAGVTFAGGNGAAGSGTPLPVNRWTHVAGTFDGTIFQIFVDGVLAAQAVGDLGWPSGGALTLGSSGDCPPFAGILDEISIYNRALAPREIAAIYTASRAEKCDLSVPPGFLLGPTNVTTASGGNAAFSVTPTEALVSTIQWYYQGRPIPGANQLSLEFTNVLAPAAGGFFAVLGNRYGQTTSATAQLVVVTTAPTFSQQPVATTNRLGYPALLSALAVGSAPLDYQWFQNGVPVPGAASTNLAFSNLKSGNSGAYTLVATNFGGAATSQIAYLEVTVPICAPFPPGLTAWFAGETNTLDSSGGWAGQLRGNVIYAHGWVGQAFSFDGSGAAVAIPDSPAVNFSGTTPMSVELWAYLTGGQGTMHLLGKRGAGCGDYEYQLAIDPTDGLQFGGGTTFTPSGRVATGVQLPLQTWWHLAATFDGATFAFYTNGVLAATGTGQLGSSNNVPLLLGDSSSCQAFAGLLDEVTFYQRALGAAEIQAIFNAGETGKCPAVFPPTILLPPVATNVASGRPVTLAVSAGGTPPLTYQWQRDGVNLAGAAQASLTFSATSPTNAGLYTVVVANGGGAVTSAPVQLLVLTVPTNCAPPPMGLTAWFAGEMNTLDTMGGLPGQLQGNAAFVPGVVGQAFSFDGAGAVLSIPDSAAVNFFGTNAMSLELWAYRTGTQTTMSLVGKRDVSCGAFEYQLAFDPSGGLQFGGGAFGASLGGVATGVQLPLQTWWHLAVTYDGANFAFYTNGVPAATGTGQLGASNNVPLLLGGASSCPAFAGLLDEVTLYQRALSAAEIQALYLAGAAGKCPTNFPPQIILPPVAAIVTNGLPATLMVTAVGTAPLSYQWQQNGVNLAGAAQAMLTFAAIAPTNAGLYTVVVANASGAITSAPVQLSVITVPSNCVTPPAGLVAWWAGDGNPFDRLPNTPEPTVIGGVTFVPGAVGGALNFDGLGGWVDIADAPALDFTDAQGMTVECWVYPTTSETSLTFVGKQAPGCGQLAWQLGQDSYHGLGFYGGGGVAAAIPYTVLPVGVWTHLAGTAGNGTLCLYTNGNLAATGPGSLGATIATHLTIGKGGCSGFAGGLDEVSLFSRPLSPAEVLTLYSAGSHGKCSPPNPPRVVTQPQPFTAFPGQSGTLAVNAAGPPPLTYQWLLGGHPIAGGTNSALVLTNLQAITTGPYSVEISNGFGSVTRAAAAITLVAPQCYPKPAGLLGWWQGEGNPVDSTGAHPGYLSGGLTYASGESGTAFSFNGTDALVTVPDARSLYVDDTDGMSLEFWVNSAGSNAPMNLVGQQTPNCGGLHYLVADNVLGGLSFYGASGAIHTGWRLPIGAWVHVAATCSGGVLNLYTNGVFCTNGPGTLGPDNGADLTFGNAGSCWPFAGFLDEIALYNRALAPAEVAGIYRAGAWGKCAPPSGFTIVPTNTQAFIGGSVAFSAGFSGNQVVTWQWNHNGLPIPGATNATLVMDPVQAPGAGLYSVTATTGLGATNSPPARLQVLGVTVADGVQMLTNHYYSYYQSATLWLTNLLTGGDVFYTLDGTPPGPLSTPYTGPIVVDHEATLNAIGYSPDFTQSAVAPTVTLHVLPGFSLNLSTPGGGIVHPQITGNSGYPSNTTVRLVHTAMSGWSFLQWNGDVNTSNLLLGLIMRQNYTVQGIFGTTLNLPPNGSGTILADPATALYPYGSNVRLTAVPSAGNYFAVWSGVPPGTPNPFTFPVTNANPTIAALFLPLGTNQAALTAVPMGHGTVAVSPAAAVYPNGAKVTLTAQPAANERFLGWSGAATGTQNPLHLTLSGSTTVYANFTRTFQLTLQPSPSGGPGLTPWLWLNGDLGLNYRLDGSSNLVDWVPLNTWSNNPVGALEFLDPAATNLSPRYYRGVRLP